jgi:Holliday junction resolvase RusA-like endonuclease
LACIFIESKEVCFKSMEIENRRSDPRFRIFKGGRIEFGGASIDCTVRNATAAGAALEGRKSDRHSPRDYAKRPDQGEPKSTQHIYGLVCHGRFPRRYMTDQGRALKEQYQWEARAQWRDKPLKGEVRMHVTKRKADWDNFYKLSCDALNCIAYEDDSQIRQSRSPTTSMPRIELAVEPC